MKLYSVEKNQNDEFEVVSNDVLYERNSYTNGNISAVQYVIHQNGSPDGSVSIMKAIACYTEQEAIETYSDFLHAKKNDYRKKIELVDSEILKLCELEERS